MIISLKGNPGFELTCHYQSLQFRSLSWYETSTRATFYLHVQGFQGNARPPQSFQNMHESRGSKTHNRQQRMFNVDSELGALVRSTRTRVRHILEKTACQYLFYFSK